MSVMTTIALFLDVRLDAARQAILSRILAPRVRPYGS